MERTKINRLLATETPMGRVLINGWVRTRRDASSFSFIEVNDGSCLTNIQVIAELPVKIDDIDHLGNRRVRAVGELLENQYRVGGFGGGQPCSVPGKRTGLGNHRRACRDHTPGTRDISAPEKAPYR